MKSNRSLISHLLKPFKVLFSKSRRPIIGGLIFILGSLIGFGFNSLAVIADLNAAGFWGDSRDAAAFDHSQSAPVEPIKINCPIFLAPKETGVITAAFHNPHQTKVDISVKAAVSERDLLNYRALDSTLLVDPGEDQSFSWQVTRQDAIEKNLILTRVFLMGQNKSTPYPARTDSCGIFVLNFLGLTGTSVIVLMVVSSSVCLVAGSVLLYFSDAILQKSSPRLDYGLYGLAAILIVDMIANLLGWWIFAGLLLLLAMLLTGILIPNMFFQKAN